MLRVAYLNAWEGGSTGKIVAQLQSACKEQYIRTIALYGRGSGENNRNRNLYYVNSKLNFYEDVFASRLLDNQGHNSIISTTKAIKILKKFKPDIIHIHNIHGYWINYQMLFKYIKENNIPVIWTLHDCWPITGHCACFQYLNCENRENGCGNCPGKEYYPKAYVDRSDYNFKDKSKRFGMINNMTIVTPSYWLKQLVDKSYLNKYKVRVIHNEIDSKVFKPSDYEYLYEKYNIPKDKKIVLYVAMNTEDPWKGFNLLLESAQSLPSDYLLIVVGACKYKTTERIINVGRTENQKDMAAFYSMADVLANPSLDDNYPTVNIEALACGTPVVAFQTGGIPEQIDDEVGKVCKEKTSIALGKAITFVVNQGKSHYHNACMEKCRLLVTGKGFIKEYLNIYRSSNETTDTWME